MDLASIEGRMLFKCILYIVMPHFSCSVGIGSKDVEEDLHDIRSKHHDQYFMIFHVGIDSGFTDISMHRIEINEIKIEISM